MQTAANPWLLIFSYTPELVLFQAALCARQTTEVISIQLQNGVLAPKIRRNRSSDSADARRRSVP